MIEDPWIQWQAQPGYLATKPNRYRSIWISTLRPAICVDPETRFHASQLVGCTQFMKHPQSGYLICLGGGPHVVHLPIVQSSLDNSPAIDGFPFARALYMLEQLRSFSLGSIWSACYRWVSLLFVGYIAPLLFARFYPYISLINEKCDCWIWFIHPLSSVPSGCCSLWPLAQSKVQKLRTRPFLCCLKRAVAFAHMRVSISVQHWWANPWVSNGQGWPSNGQGPMMVDNEQCLMMVH